MEKVNRVTAQGLEDVQNTKVLAESKRSFLADLYIMYGGAPKEATLLGENLSILQRMSGVLNITRAKFKTSFSILQNVQVEIYGLKKQVRKAITRSRKLETETSHYY